MQEVHEQAARIGSGDEESDADFMARNAAAASAITTAQAALDEALAARQRVTLEARAERERKELDASIARKRRAFEDGLGALSETLGKEGAKLNTAHAMILKLFGKFGVDFKASGKESGGAFVAGLKEALGGAAAKAGALKGTISKVASDIKVPQLAGGGSILQSGLAVVHKGETITPARPAGRGGGNVTNNFNFPNYVGSKAELAQMLRTELVKIGRREPNVLGAFA